MDEVNRIRRQCFAVGMLMAACIYFGNSYVRSLGQSPVSTFSAYSTLGIAIVYVAWVAYRVNKVRWTIKRQNYHLCLKCFYSLKGLASSGICPECGTPFDANDLKEKWQRELKKLPF
jgi:uncharacterized paraquat-inducible protein A